MQRRLQLGAAGRAGATQRVAVARALFIAHNAEEREAAIDQRMKSQAVMNAYGTSADERRKSSMVSDGDLRKAAEEGVLLGTPEEIVARLKWLEARGVGYVVVTSRSVEELRIFAQEVMPAFT